MIDKKALAEMAGEEATRKPRPLVLPIIRMQGREGKFLRIDPTKDGFDKPKEIGQLLEGAIVRVRCQLSEMGAGYSRNSAEYDSPKEKVVVWERQGKNKAMKLDEDTPENLRAKYQTLKSMRVLYLVLRDGSLVKLAVKGSGLGSLFEYFNSFGQDEHFFEFYTKFQPVEQTHESFGKYWAVHTSRGPAVNDQEMEKIAGHIQALSTNLKRLKDYYGTPDEVERSIEKEETALSDAEGDISVNTLPEASEGDLLFSGNDEA